MGGKAAQCTYAQIHSGSYRGIHAKIIRRRAGRRGAPRDGAGPGRGVCCDTRVRHRQPGGPARRTHPGPGKGSSDPGTTVTFAVISGALAMSAPAIVEDPC